MEKINQDRDWVTYWEARQEYALMRAEIASKALEIAPRVGQLLLFGISECGVSDIDNGNVYHHELPRN